MSKRLDVYLHDSLAGQLEQDKYGRVSFVYDGSWLEKPGRMPLSHSLPLRPEPYEGKECQGFFAGVLPEEQNREIIASILGISAGNGKEKGSNAKYKDSSFVDHVADIVR